MNQHQKHQKNTITTYATKDLEEHQISKDKTENNHKAFHNPNIDHQGISEKRAQSKISTNRQTKGTRGATGIKFYKSSCSQILGKIKDLQLPLWNDSSTCWTRDMTPQYHIPKAVRFTSLQQDRKNNSQFLRLNLRKSLDKKTSFAKSVRKNHWINKTKAGFPSSASYGIQRFLDNSFNKTLQHQPSKFFSTESNKIIHNPEIENQADSDHFLNHAHTTTLINQSRFDQLRGRTFYKTKNYPKVYIDHGRNMPYQQQLFSNNAAVGDYSIRQQESGKNKPHYSMRKILTRFNQKLGNTPGPLDYITNVPESKQRRSTRKSTFTNSRRLDLSKPLNETPGPSGYDVTRFLEKKHLDLKN